MPRTKIVDGVEIQLTPEEESARDAEEAQAESDRQEYLKVKYKDDRRMAYPSYADQFDTIYHQGLDAWKAEIKAVKDAHPKPE